MTDQSRRSDGAKLLKVHGLGEELERSEPVAAGVIPENPKAARSSSSMKTSSTRTEFSSLT
jgi:hypothetical protein